MAEETAGIGNAAALITRARPQDFGIVQGLKMAEASALGKAKREAAAAAKKQTQLQKMSDMFSIVPKYKTQTIADYAVPQAKQAYVDFSLAGNPEQEFSVRSGFLQTANKNAIIDDKLYGMLKEDPNKFVSPSKYVSVFDKTLKESKDLGLASESMYNAQKSYLPPAFRQVQLTGAGDFDYTPVEKVDLSSLLEKTIESVGRRRVELTPLEEQYKVEKFFTDDDIQATANRIVKDHPEAVRYITNTDDWQKYYEDKYGKNPDLLNNPENVIGSVKEYLVGNLEKNYAQQNTTKGIRGSLDIGFNGGGGNTLNIGGKIFRKESADIDDLERRFRLNNIKLGENEGAERLIQALKGEEARTGKDLTTRIVTFPNNIEERFNISDKNREDKSVRKVLPIAAYVSSSGFTVLQYQEPESKNSGQMYITVLDENGKASLATHLNGLVKKKDKNDYVVDAISKKFNINFMPEGGTMMGGQNSKVKGVKTQTEKTISRDAYAKMNAAERKAFKDSGGQVK